MIFLKNTNNWSENCHFIVDSFFCWEFLFFLKPVIPVSRIRFKNHPACLRLLLLFLVQFYRTYSFSVIPKK